MEQNSPLLLTPGPVAVAPSTWEAIAQTAIHQRSPEFEPFFAGLQTGLRYLFQTAQPVVSLAGSGTMGMEMTMWSLFAPGDKVVVQDFGKFSQRWCEYAEEIGLEVVRWSCPWGAAPKVAEVENLMAAHPDLIGWVLTHVGTSTGMASDLEEIAFAIRERDAEQLIVVDGICSVGIQALYFDAWGLDAAVAASQKGLANPAGTAFVALSARAVARLPKVRVGTAYHLFPYLDYLSRGSYPFTPPVHLFFGVKAVLDQLQAQGLPAHWNAVQARKRAFDQALEALGAEVAGPEAGQGLSVFSFPGQDHVALQARLQADHGIVVANGQGPLRGQILRVGHFGAVQAGAMQVCLDGLRKVLQTAKA